jgi:predicted nucleic acid-binding protein
VLTLGELQKGLEKLGSTRRRDVLQAWLDRDVVEQFSSRILPVDSEVAVMWGRMQASLERAGKPIPSLDGLICATALTHNLVVVTRNTRDFESTGVQLLNPCS